MILIAFAYQKVGMKEELLVDNDNELYNITFVEAAKKSAYVSKLPPGRLRQIYIRL